MDPDQIRERVRASLRYFVHDQEHVKGWYYHFVNRKNGERVWGSEPFHHRHRYIFSRSLNRAAVLPGRC